MKLSLEVIMKSLLIFLLTFTSINVWACNDKMADDLVMDRLKTMAKRYDATKIGVGVSILWGDTRVTSVSLLNGSSGDDGKKIDRMGTIFINMETCVVKAKLMGIFDTIEMETIK